LTKIITSKDYFNPDGEEILSEQIWIDPQIITKEKLPTGFAILTKRNITLIILLAIFFSLVLLWLKKK